MTKKEEKELENDLAREIEEQKKKLFGLRLKIFLRSNDIEEVN